MKPNHASDAFIKRLWQIAPEREADAQDPDSVAFVQLMFSQQPDEEHQPPKDDPLLPNRPKAQEPLEMPGIIAVPLRFETPFVAGNLCGMIVLIAGLAGWIALGVAVLIVERPRQKT
jgi:hypothetical protein